MRVVQQGSGRCPVDNVQLTEQLIYPDNFATREVNQLPVHCKNKETLPCEWVGTLSALSRHMEVGLKRFVCRLTLRVQQWTPGLRLF